MQNIVCLNLDKRIDQQHRILKEFWSHNLAVSFFIVGDGHTLSANKYDSIDVEEKDIPARYGYPAWSRRTNSWNAFNSYKKIIAKAKALGWEYVTLLEDDCTLLPNFKEVVGKAIEELFKLPAWDMFYFCSNHTYTPTTQLSPHILKLNGSGGFQFVSIKNTLYDKFIDMPMLCPIDQGAARYLHSKHNCYGIWPNVAIPIGNTFSYCEGYAYDNTPQYNNKGC